MSHVSGSDTVPAMSQSLVFRVALAVPLRALFDYLPPDQAGISRIEPGTRLRVPFGRGERIAILVEIVDQPQVDPALLKPVKEILDDCPLLTLQDIHFMQWVAAYYQHPSGEVMLSLLPARLRKGEPPVTKTQACWLVTDSGKALPTVELSRSPRQQQLMQFFQQEDAPVSRERIRQQFESIPSALKQLEEKGWVVRKECLVTPACRPQLTEAPVLNQQQRKAAESINNCQGFSAYLLHGITGSGKTEVYLAAANNILLQKKQVLIMVPEIALTPQLLERFETRIQEPMVALHSGLSETERCFAWQQAASSQARVVIGTRSAIFTPMPELGLIIVDEEHDLSFKQQEGFRYSARDMAVALAKRRDIPVVLGSATPSFESLHNVTKNNYRLLQLTQRAGKARLPDMDLVDVRSVKLLGGFSPVTLRLVGEELNKGHQVLVFINRRGFAPVITCHDCGWVGQCHRCDARLTVHAGSKRLWCHHCGYQQHIPKECPQCQGSSLLTLGQGTEKVEEMLNQRFPQASCVRIDRDTTRRKGSMHEKLDAVRKGRHQLLVGTQMLAKGHDFPDVTLVVMMDIDQGLFGSDFRASERMAQQIMQVAGRAGRADKPGRVLIQTRHPDHPLLHLLLDKGYADFAQQALQERKQAEFPPFSYQVLIRAEANRADLPDSFLRRSIDVAGSIQQEGIEFWGPVPAVMQRKAGVHRFHLLIQSSSRQYLHKFLDQWLAELQKLPDAKKVRWSVDVDPQDFYT